MPNIRLGSAASRSITVVSQRATGFGAYSLDAMLGIAGLWTPKTTGIVLALGVIGALGNLALRRRSTTTAKT